MVSGQNGGGRQSVAAVTPAPVVRPPGQGQSKAAKRRRAAAGAASGSAGGAVAGSGSAAATVSVPRAGSMRWPTEPGSTKKTLHSVPFSSGADKIVYDEVLSGTSGPLAASFDGFDLVKVARLTFRYQSLLPRNSSVGGMVQIHVLEDGEPHGVADLTARDPLIEALVDAQSSALVHVGRSSAFESYLVGRSPDNRGARAQIRVAVLATMNGTLSGTVGAVQVHVDWVGRRSSSAKALLGAAVLPPASSTVTVTNVTSLPGLLNASRYKMVVKGGSTAAKWKADDGTWHDMVNASARPGDPEVEVMPGEAAWKGVWAGIIVVS